MSKITPTLVYNLYLNHSTGESRLELGELKIPGFLLVKQLVDYAEYAALANSVSKDYGTGMSQSSMSYRYSQIHAAVDQMGGFANFQAWVKEHAKDYFMALEKALSLIDRLLQGKNKDEAKAFLERYKREIDGSA